MVTPTFFDIEYAINPFMKDANGNLHQVNKPLARQQWADLKQAFENLNVKVEVLEGQPKLPDMVFCANQAFPFMDPATQEPSVMLGRMRSDLRQPEVSFFKDWFMKHNYKVYSLESDQYSFEANGDLLPVPNTHEYWGGIGPRTDQRAYEEIQKRFTIKINTLELTHSHFYHLDTCFFILDQQTCAYIPEAFSADSVAKIKKGFKKLIEIPLDEGMNSFAGNSFCPDGKNVVLQKGSSQLVMRLKEYGFNPVEVDTSEFIKSGGSVFCMKLQLPVTV